MHWYNYCCIKYKLNKFQLFIKSKWLNDGILFGFSPRMWRWSSLCFSAVGLTKVFSTYVEVIPSFFSKLLNVLRFLHVCGGDPPNQIGIRLWQSFSPRMWRWSQTKKPVRSTLTVFSTYVEVILSCAVKFFATFCFLHVCGGDPKGRFGYHNQYKFSPRMWRWS